MKEREKTREELRSEMAEMQKRFAELKEHEREIRKAEKQLQEELIEHEKISALGRLTANVAHEIRNPITAIGGLARRLKKSTTLREHEREYIEMIIEEASRLENVLREVISFTSKTAYHRSEHDINDLVHENLLVFETVSREHGITIRQKLEKTPSIYIDKASFMGAIRNIISNAIDAMPDGGTLTATSGVDYVQGKNFVVLKLADTGIGIPEENITRIFEPFFTTKATKKETGLGLSITKKCIEDHGGFIRVESTVGRGTTFSMYLPYRSAPQTDKDGTGQ